MKQLKPMLPTLVSSIPERDGWEYEVKYDGFRAILYIEANKILLYSRNLRSFNDNFPEVIHGAKTIQNRLKDTLPVMFDGEICVLESEWKANFSSIQQRGRLKNKSKILKAATTSPCQFLMFDILMLQNQPLLKKVYKTRKKRLKEWAKKAGVPEVTKMNPGIIQLVPAHQNGSSLFKTVQAHHGEGIVAKRCNSPWESGVRTSNWLKIKNFYRGNFIVTAFDEQNGYVHVAVLHQQKPAPIGLFSHGLEGKEREALIRIVKSNQTQKTGTIIEMNPGVCVELEFLELYDRQLRQPRFKRFLLDVHWEECTWEALQKKMGN